MNVVIPMAGRGSRLAGHGDGRPKPLIEVDGTPLWHWAVSCLPLAAASRVVFVALDEHIRRYQLRAEIPKRLGRSDVRLVGLADVTDGQLRTVVAGAAELDLDTSLLVFNADTWFRHDQQAFERTIRDDSVDGCLGVGEMAGDRWSFARTDRSGRVVEVAEKRRISDHASTGLYYFRNTRTFLRDAAAMFARPIDGEHFVAPLYSLMIERGERLIVQPCERFMGIGTPDELGVFNDHVAAGKIRPPG